MPKIKQDGPLWGQRGAIIEQLAKVAQKPERMRLWSRFTCIEPAGGWLKRWDRRNRFVVLTWDTRAPYRRDVLSCHRVLKVAKKRVSVAMGHRIKMIGQAKLDGRLTESWAESFNAVKFGIFDVFTGRKIW